MMNHSEEGTDRKLAGCGMAVIVLAGLIALGIAAAVIFVLFNIGAWIGGQ